MKFTELSCCPFCGCEEFFEKRWASGPVWYSMRFDGGEGDNSEMYSALTYRGTGRVYCVECDRYLGNVDTGEVSVKVARMIEKRGLCDGLSQTDGGSSDKQG